MADSLTMTESSPSPARSRRGSTPWTEVLQMTSSLQITPSAEGKNDESALDDDELEPEPPAFDPETPRDMNHYPPPEPGSDFSIVMVGAGNIMFGSDEGPWNHSFRFEHKLGPRLKVAALIDPNTERANNVLAEKCKSFVVSAYKDTKVYKTIDEYYAALKAGKHVPPRAIVVGCPPAYRGGVTKGNDLELTLIKLFPTVPYFIEKVSCIGPWFAS